VPCRDVIDSGLVMYARHDHGGEDGSWHPILCVISDGITKSLLDVTYYYSYWKFLDIIL